MCGSSAFRVRVVFELRLLEDELAAALELAVLDVEEDELGGGLAELGGA